MVTLLAFHITNLPQSWAHQIFSSNNSEKMLEILFNGWEHNLALNKDDVLSYLTNRYIEDIVNEPNRDQELIKAYMMASAGYAILKDIVNTPLITNCIIPLVSGGRVIESVSISNETVRLLLSAPK